MKEASAVHIGACSVKPVLIPGSSWAPRSLRDCQVTPFIFPGWQVPVSHAPLWRCLAGCDGSLPGWDGEGPGERHKPHSNSKNAAIICALTSRWLRWVPPAPSQQCCFRKTMPVLKDSTAKTQGSQWLLVTAYLMSRKQVCIEEAAAWGSAGREFFSLHHVDFDVALLVWGKDLVNAQKTASFVCKCGCT